jgi:hypothetical protein
MAVNLLDVLVSGTPDTSALRGAPACAAGGVLVTVSVLAARRRPGHRTGR